MEKQGRTRRRRPSPAPGNVTSRPEIPLGTAFSGPFQPDLHTVPGLLKQRIREAGFVVLERANVLTVQAGPDQPDDLIWLRMTAGVGLQAEAMDAPVGMNLGYQMAARNVARWLDAALQFCEQTGDVQPLLQALEWAREELRVARRRFPPSPPARPRRRAGIQIVHGGLPSLGKRR